MEDALYVLCVAAAALASTILFLMIPQRILRSELCTAIFLLTAAMLGLGAGHAAFGVDLPPIGSGAMLKSYCVRFVGLNAQAVTQGLESVEKASYDWSSWSSNEEHFFDLMCQTLKQGGKKGYQTILALIALGAGATVSLLLALTMILLPNSGGAAEIQMFVNVPFSGSLAMQRAHPSSDDAKQPVKLTCIEWLSSSYLCTAATNGRIKVWSIPAVGSLMPIKEFKSAHETSITAMAVARSIGPNMGGEPIVLTAAANGSVKMWSGSSLKPLQTLQVAATVDRQTSAEVHSLVCADDLSTIYAGDAAGVMHSWAAEERKKAVGFAYAPVAGAHDSGIRAMTIANGALCVAFTYSCSRTMCNLLTVARQSAVATHRCSGCDDGKIVLWTSKDSLIGMISQGK